jgi:hypothetical protein
MTTRPLRIVREDFQSVLKAAGGCSHHDDASPHSTLFKKPLHSNNLDDSFTEVTALESVSSIAISEDSFISFGENSVILSTSPIVEEETKEESIDEALSPQSRKVSFATIQLREYERILCCNPSCSEGASIGLGWDVVSESCHEIKEWESMHKTRKTKAQLALTAERRDEMLIDLGYTVFDIAASECEIRRIQAERFKSIRNYEKDQRLGMQNTKWNRFLGSLSRFRGARKQASDARKGCAISDTE